MKVSLKAMRVNAGITQAEAAKHLGVSIDHIKWLEKKGGATIRYNTLMSLCSLYKCTADDILLPINSAESELRQEA